MALRRRRERCDLLVAPPPTPRGDPDAVIGASSREPSSTARAASANVWARRGGLPRRAVDLSSSHAVQPSSSDRPPAPGPNCSSRARARAASRGRDHAPRRLARLRSSRSNASAPSASRRRRPRALRDEAATHAGNDYDPPVAGPTPERWLAEPPRHRSHECRRRFAGIDYGRGTPSGCARDARRTERTAEADRRRGHLASRHLAAFTEVSGARERGRLQFDTLVAGPRGSGSSGMLVKTHQCSARASVRLRRAHLERGQAAHAAINRSAHTVTGPRAVATPSPEPPPPRASSCRGIDMQCRFRELPRLSQAVRGTGPVRSRAAGAAAARVIGRGSCSDAQTTGRRQRSRAGPPHRDSCSRAAETMALERWGRPSTARRTCPRRRSTPSRHARPGSNEPAARPAVATSSSARPEPHLDALWWNLPVVTRRSMWSAAPRQLTQCQDIRRRSSSFTRARDRHHGVRVTTLERTVVDCATLLRSEPALISLTPPHAGADLAVCREILGSLGSRRGTARARAVLEHADGGAESPGRPTQLLVLRAVSAPVTQVP